MLILNVTLADDGAVIMQLVDEVFPNGGIEMWLMPV